MCVDFTDKVIQKRLTNKSSVLIMQLYIPVVLRPLSAETKKSETYKDMEM